ncbi:hypothetical protein BGZ46_005116, partial [Entomortierella lignicola]
ETYSFSLGSVPAPMTTIVQTTIGNFTCDYIPIAGFTYTTCTTDQSSALIISLSIGFFLALFLSFLKQVPTGGTPPLADSNDEGGAGVPVANNERQVQKKRKYRSGIISHVWGHAALSFVAFGTLSLFSASVSQCLFPSIPPWVFVFTQIILLVICCFIAMFWIEDPSLSIGLMVVPQTETTSTQTGSGYRGPGPSQTQASTSTTALSTNGFTVSPDPSPTSAGLANVALASAAMNSAMSTTSAFSGTTAVGGVSRTVVSSKRGQVMSSLSEKRNSEDNAQENETWECVNEQESRRDGAIITTTEEYVQSTSTGPGHLSLKME